MRTKILQWKDKRSGFTRRARVFAENYQGKGSLVGCTNIRLTLEDTSGLMHHYPSTPDEAYELLRRFENGEIDFRATKE